MPKKTSISWTDHTFNPWLGCAKVSDGCKNCYAETFTKNRMGYNGKKEKPVIWGPNAERRVTKGPWTDVKKWNRSASTHFGVLGSERPNLCFTGSMCDIFEDHPTANETRPAVWDSIRECQNIHFQILTKRPERIAANLPEDWGPDGWPNVWLGTSVEDMRVAERADLLRSIPAVVRFISYEPALGPLDELDLTGIDWVIYGGESGSGHRADKTNWARSMRQKCAASEIAFFYKQSSGHRSGLGVELDGEVVQAFPSPRTDTL